MAVFSLLQALTAVTVLAAVRASLVSDCHRNFTDDNIYNYRERLLLDTNNYQSMLAYKDKVSSNATNLVANSINVCPLANIHLQIIVVFHY